MWYEKCKGMRCFSNVLSIISLLGLIIGPQASREECGLSALHTGTHVTTRSYRCDPGDAGLIRNATYRHMHNNRFRHYVCLPRSSAHVSDIIHWQVYSLFKMLVDRHGPPPPPKKKKKIKYVSLGWPRFHWAQAGHLKPPTNPPPPQPKKKKKKKKNGEQIERAKRSYL